MDEKSLIKLVIDDDDRAITELYWRYIPKLRRFFESRIKSVKDAEEVTHDTFLSVLDAFHALKIPWGILTVFQIRRTGNVARSIRLICPKPSTAETSSTNKRIIRKAEIPNIHGTGIYVLMYPMVSFPKLPPNTNEGFFGKNRFQMDWSQAERRGTANKNIQINE